MPSAGLSFACEATRDLFFFASLGILTDLGGVFGLSPAPTNAATLPTAAPTTSATLARAFPSFFFLSAIYPLKRTPATAKLRPRASRREESGNCRFMRQLFDSFGAEAAEWLAENAGGGSSGSVLSGWPERPFPTGYHRYAHRIRRQRRSSLSAQKSAHPAYFANSSRIR